MIGPFASWRRRLYRWGVLRSDALPRPVISVGNLSVGGSGKTPHVRFLASWLKGQGLRVAVLSRGYGRVTRGVLWVSRGDGPVVSASEGGDEPVLLSASLRGVPVVVGESRADAGRECLKARETDVFLLDDGFQHLSLRRNADILLVDAGRGLGNRRCLPLGPLREPPGSARFADALVVTKCRDLAAGRTVADAVPFPEGRPKAFSRLVPLALADRRGAETPLPPAGEEIAAFSGLARNASFLETLREAGFSVGTFLPFSDHHVYRPADLERIASAAAGRRIVTTEKDMVRLPEDVPFRVEALKVEVEFLAGWGSLSRLVLDRAGAGGAG
jgi:tetraacyldisaccharide 4'-kinase